MEFRYTRSFLILHLTELNSCTSGASRSLTSSRHAEQKDFEGSLWSTQLYSNVVLPSLSGRYQCARIGIMINILAQFVEFDTNNNLPNSS
jgi:hypothetical protein